MNFKYLLALPVMVALAMMLAACGQSSVPDVPAASANGHDCYYVKSPQEAQNLKQQGRCPQNSVAMQAPMWWIIMYYPMLNSPWYRNNIVPASARSSYKTQMTTFGDTYANRIKAQAPKAKYLDEEDNVVTGQKAGVSEDGESFSGLTGEEEEGNNSSVNEEEEPNNTITDEEEGGSTGFSEEEGGFSSFSGEE